MVGVYIIVLSTKVDSSRGGLMKSARRSKCIHCGRKIVERQADVEYINEYLSDDLVWFDTVENRSMCLINRYSTAHITEKEWNSCL